MPDYMYLLESRLSPEQRATLLRVQELARAQESNVYLSGGAVRDLLSGMSLRDLDFTIEGNPQRMVRELEKGGARVTVEDERLREYEIVFSGEVDGSISAARDAHYPRPGARPEIRWSTIMEDLRRRDFSINAVAISLNPASRGLLLDPTNGLADLERREVRVLSIHSFTNQPVRLLRAARFCARMNFQMEARTQEWFDLAIERGLQDTIEKNDIGKELIAAGREESPLTVLKKWETLEMLGLFHPKLQRRRPDYEGLSRLAKTKEMFAAAGIRVRLKSPAVFYILRKLGPGMNSVLRNLEVPEAEAAEVIHLPAEAKKLLQVLRGSKTKTARQAYEMIAKTSPSLLVFMMAEFRNAKAAGKVKNYLQKWRPMRMNLPLAELESLGVARGAKFDKVIEQVFDAQLRGRGKNPEEVTKMLRQFAGIKEPPKPKEETRKRRGRIPKAEKARAGEAPEVPAEGQAEESARKQRAGAERRSTETKRMLKAARDPAAKRATRGGTGAKGGRAKTGTRKGSSR